MGETTEWITIGLQEELATYNLEGKWNDYIGVQKCVIGTLKEEGFLENNVVINEKSGMVVRISAKGIKEILGKGKRFQNLPKDLKQLKVASLRYLPKVIEKGVVFADDVPNTHGDVALYAYIISSIFINGAEYGIRVAVKKRISDNIFWIHNIDCNEKSPELLDLRSVRIGN